MNRVFKVAILCLLLAPARESAAWQDTGHMVVAQIAYLRLTPAARARVEGLLITPPGRRPLIHLCSGFYTPDTCEKTYDPVTIAVWMDDFRGDSLNEPYAPWHYINFRPIFDGVPERSSTGAEPENVLSRINWAIDTLRYSAGARKDAETLGFLYHLVGDVHQPLHATTRYAPAQPDGDAGGNGFKLQMPPETWITNLHAFWDGAGGAFGFGPAPKRPLDPAAKARILTYAQELMQEHPADATTEWKELDPHAWVVESNTLARQVVYANVKEGEAPSKSYTEQAQRLSRKRIATAGYRLAAVLNALFVK